MAEFLTVNLGSILRDQNSFVDTDPITQKKEATATQKRDPSQISDWAKELKDRLAENRALDADERQSDYEVETQFFEDYFTNGDSAWDANCAELLIDLGEPLKKAIKVLGFDRNINPILGFITDDYVIRSLLVTKLLNVNTFKAIYNAVAKKLVVDSEFFASNDYNIIYCQDLYRRPVADIIEYLTIQKSTLSPQSSTYTKADQDRNKKTFFYIASIKELDPKKRTKEIEALSSSVELPSANDVGTKLNSIEVAHNMSGVGSGVYSNNNNTNNSISTTVNAVAKKIGNSPAQAFAAIQYLSATTNVPEAAKALKHDMFKNVSMEALMAAYASVTKIMKETNLPESEVRPFVAALLRELERN